MLRTWDFKISLDGNKPDTTLHLQIVNAIIGAIESGRLKPLTAMPGTRELAASLKVNRKTVVLAYGELISQGWLVTQSRKGTFVGENSPSGSRYGIHATPSKITKLEVDRSSAFRASRNHPRSLNLTENFADVRLVPYELLARSYRRALVTCTRQNSINKTDPMGSPELRKEIAEMLNMEKGFRVSHEHTCLVSSFQAALFVAAKITAKPLASVAIESLTCPHVRDTFNACNVSIFNIGVDEEGIKVDELEEICQSQAISAVFVTPQHQYPTTVTLSAHRRKKLLKLANTYDFMIIEDDHYGQYHFSKFPTFPLATSDTNHKVIYIGSLNSDLVSGLNINYLIGPPSLMKKCAEAFSLIEPTINITQETLITELMQSGEIKRHIRKLTKIYANRREAFQNLLQEELDEWLTFSSPESGLAFWLKFKTYIQMDELINIAGNHGITLEAHSYAGGESGIQAIRVGFAALNEIEITMAIKKLKKIFEEAVNLKKTA
ncbi:transcriptional regulator, GntR family [Methylophilus rhizosphaerae]|uniref:Transcriptional regulator, GntR family n=1 Tax=Methylophilus rhizosphaerae TaxID=492660 RepID=A0A1G9EU88_9PROT|nr:PLP-dependent aminotransferase family protein [Methylophilus rhizosphaerae]SDK79732.1 transcriptional regulator, GntR family [Methylophilus rhizosphaerae]